MRPRFFVEPNQINGDLISLDGDELVHLARVLRLQVGSAIVVCDGSGKEYQAILQNIDSKLAVARITAIRDSLSEPRLKITLVQGLPKADKLDFIVQKGTEIGLTAFMPVVTERTIVRLDGNKAVRRVERWQRIAKEAAKQSGRALVPKVHMPVSWQESLSKFQEQPLGRRGFLPWEKATGGNLRDVLSAVGSSLDSAPPLDVWIFVGPEGGWSPKEVEEAGEAGITYLSLGARILRTETAGIVAASLVLYESGDLG